METSDIIKKFVKEVAHFMPDAQMVLMLRKILNKKITAAQVRHARESFYIHNGQGLIRNCVKEKIGLDLYDHRLDKDKTEDII